ncbi:trp operon leader peptide [Salmonella enterica subsp. enterica serovar Infantis]
MAATFGLHGWWRTS